MKDNLCLTCGHPHSALLVITAKCPRTGRWQDYQYCRACAKANGDLQDERAAAADKAAERAGV